MSERHGSWSRREFVERLGIVGAVGLLRMRPVNAAAEPTPETTHLRLAKYPAVCTAPQFVAEPLFQAEGFGDTQYVTRPGPTSWTMKALAAGETDIAVNYGTNLILQLDAGDPVVILGGIHVGCYELFGGERVRAVRDLRGRKVAVPELGSGHHTFVSMMASHVGLDPRKDIEWVVQPAAESKKLLAEAKIDALMAFPPDPQELRAKKIGHVVVASAVDRLSLAKPQPTCSGAPRSFKPSTGPRPRAWFEARATAIFRPSALHGHTGVTMADGERTGWAAALDL